MSTDRSNSSSQLRIGFALPQFGAQARAASRIPEYAAELENAGAASLWVGERLLAATDPEIGYAGDSTIPPEFNQVLDPFVALGLAASATKRVRLGSNVLIAPLHRPALLARSLTTIDIASRGRLIPGFGIGWSPEEYEAAQVPFSQRGARLDETLDALEAIWTDETASYDGKFVSVPRHHIELRPIQSPRPPIHLAAFGPTALARVGRRADGWLPVLTVPGSHEQAARLRSFRDTIDRAAEAAGRDPENIETIVRVNGAQGSGIADIIAAIHATAEKTGFTEFFVDTMYFADSVEQMYEETSRMLRELG